MYPTHHGLNQVFGDPKGKRGNTRNGRERAGGGGKYDKHRMGGGGGQEIQQAMLCACIVWFTHLTHRNLARAM